MGINFPPSPTPGDLYPVPPQAGVPQYKWDGTVWVAHIEDPLTYVKRSGDTMTGALNVVHPPTVDAHASSKLYVDSTVGTAVGSLITRSYIAGLTLSTAGNVVNFTVAAGVAVDSTNTVTMTLTAPMSKTVSAWAAGDGNGALDTGTIAAAAWYYVYLIRNPTTSAVDVVVSRATLTLVLPSGFTQFRRIGCMKTSASKWIAFTQIGDHFFWNTPPADVSAGAVDTVGVTFVLGGVPTGLSFIVNLKASAYATGTTSSTYYRSLISPNVASSYETAQLSDYVGGGFGAMGDLGPILTDTSARIGVRGIGVGYTSIYTKSWIDYRGRFD